MSDPFAVTAATAIKETKTMSPANPLRRLLVLTALLLCVGAAPAATSSAATPAWKVMGVTGPTNLPPISDEIQRVSVDATGGDFALTAYEAVAVATGNLTAPHPSSITVQVQSGTFVVGQTLVGDYIAPGTAITSVFGFGSVLSLGLSQPATNASAVTGARFYAAGSGDTTAALPFDATASDVKQALDDLSTVGGAGGSVEVEGGPGDAGATKPYFVRFADALAGVDRPPLVADASGLSGGGASASVSTQTEGGTPGTGVITITLANVGGAASSGMITLKIGPLPDGIETSASASGGGFSCTPTGAGQTELTCLGATPVSVESTELIKVPVRVRSAVNPGSAVPIAVEGGGATTGDEHALPITVSALPVPAGIQVLWAGAFDEDGVPSTQAGGHPARAAAFFRLNTIVSPSGQVVPAGDPRDIEVEVPPGFVGNPLITPRCPQQELTGGVSGNALCALTAAIGRLHPYVAVHPDVAGADNEPLYNNEPYFGYAAQFTARLATAQATLVGELRSDDDYGVTVTSPNIPLVYKVFGAFSALNGSPAGGNGAAFLTNPTGCSEEAQGDPVTTLSVNSWQQPQLFDRTDVALPPITGCDQLEFEADLKARPTTNLADSPTGLDVDLTIPQDNLTDPDELANPHLRHTTVQLPEGIAINPSGANGLDGCSSGEIGLLGTNFDFPHPVRFSKQPASCPDASKVGVVEVESPLLDHPLSGTVYVADPFDNPFDSLLAIYLEIDDPQTGIIAKLAGSVELDPQTGQITSTFANNPQLPFSEFRLDFKGGAHAPLSTPPACGGYETVSTLTPWSAPESGPPLTSVDAYQITQGPGGPCPGSEAALPHAPEIDAGSASAIAGADSPFVLNLSRRDGTQRFSALTVTPPPGLTAKLAGVPYCPDAALAAAAGRDGRAEQASPSCPAASRVGDVFARAGTGPDPYTAPGTAYLAGPYKGAPLSMAIVTPAVAGPFDLGVVVIRTALHVNPATAEITAVSDPLPRILDGIPLNIRSASVRLNRPQFTRNPTNCDPMALTGQLVSTLGAAAPLLERFQVGECARLGFKPRMNLRLKGGTRRGAHPSLTTVLLPRPGDANVKRLSVKLPSSAFLDQAHIGTVCTRVQWAQDACPPGSIYGTVVAYSPLLDYALRGNVYLRSSANKLPDLVPDLRGPAHQPIRVESAGRTDSVKGALRNTFDYIPDAPIDRVVVRLFGGKRGLVINSRSVCAGQNRANVRFTAHNGDRLTLRPKVRNPRCRRAKKRKAKRSSHQRSNRATSAHRTG